jgi:L-alanine-DL-glutamate epimerase-like enolase superfamily enzyme
VRGQRLDDVADIARIGADVRANSLDLLQADHTYSGIDMALWDLLGKRLQAPVWQLLGITRPFPKRPYASQLFGDTVEGTYQQAVTSRESGYTAAKFGWGPFGLGTVADDEAHVRAARKGLGDEATLLIDVGTVWIDDVARAVAVLPVLQECRVTWLEEPFVSGALAAYQELSTQAGTVALAVAKGATMPGRRST